MQPSSPLITQSPTFNSYSSNKLAEIAARVVQEFADESELPEPEDTTHNNFFSCPEEEENNNQQFDVNEDEDDEDENGDDFEFAVVNRSESRFSDPISADDIFYNGQIRPLYPLFNTKLLLDDQESLPKAKTVTKEIKNRLPLKKLFYEDRETFSCSSSEADDIDSAEPGSYCVWRPTPTLTPKKKEAGGSCKKSSSTGSTSKRWKLKDLLHRSNSDGKETFVFLTPNKEKEKIKIGGEDKDKKGKRKDGKKEGGLFQYQEQYYARSKEANKRRSYLPYKQVGFLSTVDGVGRNLHPF